MMIEKFIALFRRTAHIEGYIPPAVRVAQRLQDDVTSAATLGALSNDEVAEAVAIVDELRHDTVVILNWPHEINAALGRLWDKGVSPEEFLSQKAEAVRKTSDAGIRFSRGRPDWRFVLSDKFIKSIQNADKKLQGRILEAITKIAEAPTIPVGDTVKPLAADLKGLWRYRIGDYRLVYDPNPDEKHVTLLWFDNRGAAYS
ncbi:MAG: type II toxin-antitoxin system RelE family toxin [Gammaproteobacteria bacterium]